MMFVLCLLLLQSPPPAIERQLLEIEHQRAEDVSALLAWLPSLRASGYSIETALGDLIDNPIDKNASTIVVNIERDKAKNDWPLEVGKRIDAHCQQLGLLVRPLIHMCVMSPPLTITRPQIDDLVSILRQGIVLTQDELVREGLWKD